ncbi:MAG TPA: serine/threonine-protein kinase, partial [Kofleriaceae bacterium]|nr:serine/threonine-protein kinase [Kofleriaceae bacterium]
MSDTPEAATTVAARTPGAPASGPQTGSVVGRYRLLERLGEGGMGVVFAAKDPELQRTVAIKLVRLRGEGSEYGSRLQREAQVMARLSHPEILPVYDVGRIDDQVFVAMELVRGGTLASWLKERRRPWREALAMLVRAGRGLAAAHDAGIVHRDFKPANVLIGDDGRVRVADFGLARAIDEAPAAALDESGSELAETFTQSGAIVGTPAYMAPEQHQGRRADARSDQFAFCVALYEAVYGERPFKAKRDDAVPVVAALAAEVTAGRVQPAPGGARVPGWLRRVLLRGLAVAADERWPSMQALLATLEAVPRRRRRIAFAAGATVVAAAAAILLWPRTAEAARCRGFDDQLAGVWDPATRARLHGGLGAGADKVDAAVDDYARRWVSARTEACQAARERGEQDEATLGLRTACLDRRLRELGSLVGVLGEADPQVVAMAPELVRGLSPLDDCADVAVLTAATPAPADPAVQPDIQDAIGLVAEAAVRVRAGQLDRAAPLIDRALASAQRTKYPALEADALLWRGTLERTRGSAAAEATLQAAALAAERARDDVRRTHIYIELITVHRLVGHMVQAHQAARQAEAALSRLSEAGWYLQAGIANNEGAVYVDENQLDAGEAEYRKALRLYQAQAQVDVDAGDREAIAIEVASTEANLGLLLHARGRSKEGIALL